MDIDIQHVRDLLNRREEIDRELAAIFAGRGGSSERKPQRCSLCQQEGHSARTCPQKKD
jgi:hypothetical protein